MSKVLCGRKPNLTNASLVGHNVALIKVYDREDRYQTQLIADGSKIGRVELYNVLKKLCWELLEDIFNDIELQEPEEKVN